MESKRRVLTLKTGFWFGKSWLVNEKGERCSVKFKVISKQSCGPITALNTDKGIILYSRYNSEYKSEDFVSLKGPIKLAENVYMVRVVMPVFSSVYFLYDDELKPILEKYVRIDQVEHLTNGLWAIRSFDKWGILDITTGKLVCEPEYVAIELRGGKLIGKKRDTKVIITESEINI